MFGPTGPNGTSEPPCGVAAERSAAPSADAPSSFSPKRESGAPALSAVHRARSLGDGLARRPLQRGNASTRFGLRPAERHQANGGTISAKYVLKRGTTGKFRFNLLSSNGHRHERGLSRPLASSVLITLTSCRPGPRGSRQRFR
jgi:hypothetical protein